MLESRVKQLTITVPENLVALIEHERKVEGRNRSEFFREAARFYVGRNRTTATVTYVPANFEGTDPFASFTAAWNDGVVEKPRRPSLEQDKDRELAKWAALVESDPVFADVRAVSGDVNAIAGELLQ